MAALTRSYKSANSLYRQILFPTKHDLRCSRPNGRVHALYVLRGMGRWRYFKSAGLLVEPLQGHSSLRPAELYLDSGF